AARLRDLLSDLASVGRGKMRSPENCNIRDVIAGACETAARAAESQGVEILLDIPPEPIELSLERARMERVFLNLISNALEAMPDGGSVHIGAKEAENGVL